VSDKEIGQVPFLLQVLHQIQDLGLNGHVQGGNRLITDDELRVQGQGSGDTDTLAAASVQFMGICVDQAAGQSHGVHQLLHLLNQRSSGGALFIDDQRLRNQLADGHTGVQRGEGVLEYHLHILPELLQFSAVHLGNIPSLIEHLTLCGVM